MWCGNDAVMLFWNQVSPPIITLFSRDFFIKYDCDEDNVYFVLECDGIRIFTKERFEFLQPVPQSSQNIFEIGSLSSAAMLYDATEAFECRSARADAIIRSISSPEEMREAIQCCVMRYPLLSIAKLGFSLIPLDQSLIRMSKENCSKRPHMESYH
jgi:hypothetical protein